MDLLVFAHDYLTPIGEALIAEHMSLIEQHTQAFLIPFILVSITFIVAVFLLYVTLYRGMLARLDQDIKQLKSWLMLFPPEIIR